MFKEKLPIHKQYLVISAPITFRLIANNGTDIVERPAGVWQLDTNRLLPEKFMKNYPVFNLELEYDDTKIPEGFNFEYYFTNINLGDSLKGVSGDLVELSEVQFETIKKLLNVSDDFPYYKVLQSYKHLPKSREWTSKYIRFPCTNSKALYLGCVIIKNDGVRVPIFPQPFYIKENDNILYGEFGFGYRIIGEGNFSRVEIRPEGSMIHNYVSGYAPYSELTEYRKQDALTNIFDTESDYFMYEEVDSFDFFILTQ